MNITLESKDKSERIDFLGDVSKHYKYNGVDGMLFVILQQRVLFIMADSDGDLDWYDLTHKWNVIIHL